MASEIGSFKYEVVVDALPYIDQGYDDIGVRESVSCCDKLCLPL